MAENDLLTNLFTEHVPNDIKIQDWDQMTMKLIYVENNKQIYHRKCQTMGQP